MPLPSLKTIEWVTTDCYGTLIDWEKGILDACTKEAEKDGFSFEESKAPEGADWGDFKYSFILKDGKKYGCVITFGSGTKVFAMLLRGLYFSSASDEHFLAFFNAVYPRMKAHDFAS